MRGFLSLYDAFAVRSSDFRARKDYMNCMHLNLRIFRPGGEANSVVGKQEAKTEDKHIYEIEKAILRVGKLLKLGLGEAGTKIIRYFTWAGGRVRHVFFV